MSAASLTHTWYDHRTLSAELQMATRAFPKVPFTGTLSSLPEIVGVPMTSPLPVEMAYCQRTLALVAGFAELTAVPE